MRAKLFIIVLAAVLLASGTSYAQSNDGPAATTADCGPGSAWTFSSGSGASLMQWCVSTHGNFSKFQSPSGFEHLFVGTPWEGYAICSGTSVLVYDIGSAEGGFPSGTVTVLAGPTATGMTVRRISSDGNWQLDQQYKRDNKENDVTINMTLTRLGGATVTDVRLARIYDADNDNDFGDDTQDRTDRSTMARDIHGISLTNTTWGQAADTSIAGTFVSPACSPASVATPTTTDGLSNVTVYLGTLSSGKKGKTTFVYRRY